MKIFDVTWTYFKNFVASKSLLVQYVEGADRYYVLAFDEYYGIQCDLMFGSEADTVDFETNYKTSANATLGFKRDADGAQVVNPKFAGEGRTYQSLHFELTLGKKNDFFCKNFNLVDNSFIQVLHYKTETDLLEEGDSESLIVKTLVTLAPNFDYDIQGFCLYQKVAPITDIRMWAVMVPFLPPEYGGPKELISGACLDDSPYGVNFLDYVGDSATTMKYQGPGTNEMSLIFRFPTGTNHKVMGELFWYV